MGTRLNRLTEAVLRCTHNICFEQKYEKDKIFQLKIVIFFSREKSLYIAWTCFRNGDGLPLYLGTVGCVFLLTAARTGPSISFRKHAYVIYCNISRL